MKHEQGFIYLAYIACVASRCIKFSYSRHLGAATYSIVPYSPIVASVATLATPHLRTPGFANLGPQPTCLNKPGHRNHGQATTRLRESHEIYPLRGIQINAGYQMKDRCSRVVDIALLTNGDCQGGA